MRAQLREGCAPSPRLPRAPRGAKRARPEERNAEQRSYKEQCAGAAAIVLAGELGGEPGEGREGKGKGARGCQRHYGCADPATALTYFPFNRAEAIGRDRWRIRCPSLLIALPFVVLLFRSKIPTTVAFFSTLNDKSHRSCATREREREKDGFLYFPFLIHIILNCSDIYRQ